MMNARVIGADAVAASLTSAALTVEQRLEALRRHYSQLLVSGIQSDITKRTGGLARSYRVDREGVSSEHPAAHRHEVGFHGVDSRGRRYNDPPHPVVGPAADRVEAEFRLANEALVRSL